MTPFHLAFPVSDLEATRAFYVDRLGCGVGRESETWIDFDLRGHQITAHLLPAPGDAGKNPVDADQVPIPHFGLILPWAEWQALAERLTNLGTTFELEPKIRFQGEVGEQATMFLRDPSGNALEFKSFKDAARIFAS